MNFNKNYYKKSFFFEKIFSKEIKNNRIKFYQILTKQIKFKSSYKILDVGTTPSLEENQNIFLRCYPYKNQITCLSNQNCRILKKEFVGIKIITSSALNSNIVTNKYDIVFSNATIEHVGCNSNQLQFVKELNRIGKRYICIITPNKYFPIDFHTKLILINLLPNFVYRKILVFLGYKFFSLEKNLNLLAYSDLIKILDKAKIKNYKIIKYRYFGLVSHYMIIIKKKLLTKLSTK